MDYEFIRTIVPENDGWFYLVRLDNPSDNTTPSHYGLKTTASEGAVASTLTKAMASAFVRGGDSFDAPPTNGMFYTPFTFSANKVPNPNGNGHNVNCRKLDDYKLTCRALWLDVDVKEGGHYDTQEAALKAVMSKCDPQLMPFPTTIVDTGGGYHFYWLFDTALDLPAWLEASGKFDQYWRDAGVKFDPISRDSARVLRVPGTDNMKTGTARPCKKLDYVGAPISREWIERWPECSVPSEVTPVIKSLFGATDEDLGEHKPRYTAEVVKQCPLLEAILNAEGAGCSEPLWKNVLQFNRHTKDGDQYNVLMSRGHADYSEGGLIAKVGGLDSTVKPITCEGFRASYTADFDDDPCRQCQHRENDKIKSPLALGKEPEAVRVGAAPQPVAAPPNLMVKDGSTYLLIYGKDKTKPPSQELLCRVAIRHADATEDMTVEGRVPHLTVEVEDAGAVRSARLNMNQMLRGDKARETMNLAGMAVPTSVAANKLGDILSDWHSRLKQAGACVAQYSVQGWHVEGDDKDTFVLAQNVYRTDGSVASDPDHPANDDYQIKGDLKTWQHAADKLLGVDNYAFRMMLAGSFGCGVAPLATGRYCAALSFYSQASGIGKSTALKVARSVWAAPTQMATLDDTHNGVLSRVRREPNLPLMWDDPRGEKARNALKELLFALTFGRTKQRATVTGDAAPVTYMHNIGMIASNEPVTGNLDTQHGEAEGKRMLELVVPSVPLDKSEDAFDALPETYGVAGDALMRHVVPNIPKIRKRLEAVGSELGTELDLDAADRFYLHTFTAMYVGAELAKELGIVDFDLKQLIGDFKRIVRETRAEAERLKAENTTVTEVLDFINSRDINGGVVESFSPAGSNLTPKALKAPMSRSQPGETGMVYAPWNYVVANDTGNVRFPTGDFERWFKATYDRRLNKKAWKDRAEAEGVLVDFGARLSLRVGDLTFTGYRNRVCTEIRVDSLRGMVRTPLKAVTSTPSDASESDGS